MLENGLFGKPVIIITLTTGDMHAGVQNCVSNAEQRDVLCREKMCECQQKRLKVMQYLATFKQRGSVRTDENRWRNSSG